MRSPDQIHQDYSAALQAKDAARAEQFAKELISSHPDISTGYAALGQLYIQSQRPRDAIEVLASVVDRFPADMVLSYLLAVGYSSTYQHGKAEPYLQKVCGLKPAWTEARFMLGQNLYKAGRNTEAVAHLKFAAEHMPNHFRANYLLGATLIALDELEAAAPHMSRAVALNPGDAAARQQQSELETLLAGGKGVARQRAARWPEAVKDFENLSETVAKHVVANFNTQGFHLSPGMTVMTQGSCFAGNLARSFQRYPLTVSNIPFGEEHNSTFANRVVIKWLLEGAVDEDTSIAAENLGNEKREEYLKLIKAADLYVFTLGVAPAFFDKASGHFKMPRATATSKIAQLRTSKFRTSTVSENVENLSYIVEAIRQINPKVTFVVTVSPVPLNTTLEMTSAIQADCVSKSTLRVAAHELLQAGYDKVLYWPSFEIVRWLSGHHGRVYGNDDGSSHHIDFKLIDIIIDSFISTVGSDDLKPLPVS